MIHHLWANAKKRQLKGILTWPKAQVNARTNSVVVRFGREASQTRDGGVATTATLRAARPDASRRKSGLLGITINRGLPTQRKSR